MWDAVFKNVLKSTLDAEVTTEFDVPVANLRLDFLIKNGGNLPLPFSLCKKTILGEFKSERDRFSVRNVHRSLAKAYLHLSTLRSHEQVTLLFIIGGRKIPRSIKNAFELVQLRRGIFELKHPLHILIVELDTMEYQADNLFLGLFASKETRRWVILNALRNDQRFIISQSYFLYRDEVLNVAEAENIELDPISLSIRKAVDDIGILKVVEEVGLDRVIEEVGLDRLIEKVGLDRLIEKVGLDRLIEKVGLDRVIEEVGLDRVIEVLKQKKLTPEAKEKLRKLLDT